MVHFGVLREEALEAVDEVSMAMPVVLEAVAQESKSVRFES